MTDFGELAFVPRNGGVGMTREELYESARKEVGDELAKKWLDQGLLNGRPQLSGRVWDGDTGELIKE